VRRIVTAVVVTAAVVVVSGIVIRRCGRQADEQRSSTSRDTVGEPQSSSTAKPPAHTVALASREQRTAIAEDIARANAARAAAPSASSSVHHSAPSAPHLPDDDLAKLPADLTDRLHEAIPFLAACYRASDLHGARTARVQVTLTSSADVGTLLDPGQLRDGSGAALDPNLEGCLRTTLESLELPPLGDVESAKLEYSFAFDDDDLR
jgi:hypothetical protein